MDRQIFFFLSCFQLFDNWHRIAFNGQQNKKISTIQFGGILKNIDLAQIYGILIFLSLWPLRTQTNTPLSISKTRKTSPIQWLEENSRLKYFKLTGPANTDGIKKKLYDLSAATRVNWNLHTKRAINKTRWGRKCQIGNWKTNQFQRKRGESIRLKLNWGKQRSIP